MTDTRQDLINTLRNEIMTVQFVKVGNGDIRTMRCTLRADILPELTSKVEDVNTTNDLTKEYISVYDMDKKDWRAFRVENVISARTSTL
jgi:hypothetical protein